MKFEYGLLIAMGVLVFSTVGLIISEPYTIPQFHVPYDKAQLYEMHDVIVDASRVAFTNDPGKPYIVVRVNEFYKNPINASHLTVWGNFAQTSDYCLRNNDKCSRILMYLYEDKNGVYRQGEYFAWITDECDAKCHLGKG
ncbi:MAG: hypothetical protein ACRD9Q_07305 [Nitrososphaeraceae archaeon]